MYPTKDPVNAAIVDRWLDLHTEFMEPIELNRNPSSMGLTWTESEQQRHGAWLSETHIPKYLCFLNKELESSDYLGNLDRESIADMCWISTLIWLASGAFAAFDADTLQEYEHIDSYMRQLVGDMESSKDKNI